MHNEGDRRNPNVLTAREADRAAELPVSPFGDISGGGPEPAEINGTAGDSTAPITNGAGDQHPDADPEEPDATDASSEAGATLPGAGELSGALKAGKPEIYWHYRESLFELASNPQGDTDAKQLNRMIALSRKILEADDEHLYFQSHLVLRTMQSPAKIDLAPVIDEIEYAATSSSPINTLMRGMSYSVFGCCVAFAVAIGSVIYLEKDRDTDAGGAPGSVVTANAAATPTPADPATTSGDPSAAAAAEPPGELTKAVSAVPSNQKVRSSLGEALKKSMIVAGFFGVLGSVVSIMQRLDQFERPKRRSHSLVLFTGVALPLIGGVFAMVIAAVFRTGIVSTALTEPQPGTDFPYFYVVIGFLSGFSERFAGNILGRAEDGISGDREVTIRKEADGSVEASEKTKLTTTSAAS